MKTDDEEIKGPEDTPQEGAPSLPASKDAAAEALSAKRRAAYRKGRTKKERMVDADREVLDVEGAAKTLGVSRWLVLSYAKQKKIPGKKVGREWRFRRSQLLAWLTEPDEDDASMPANIKALLDSGKAKLLPRGGG